MKNLTGEREFTLPTDTVLGPTLKYLFVGALV